MPASPPSRRRGAARDGVLLAHRVTIEPHTPGDPLARLHLAPVRMARWLGLSDVRGGEIVHPA